MDSCGKWFVRFLSWFSNGDNVVCLCLSCLMLILVSWVFGGCISNMCSVLMIMMMLMVFWIIVLVIGGRNFVVVIVIVMIDSDMLINMFLSVIWCD